MTLPRLVQCAAATATVCVAFGHTDRFDLRLVKFDVRVLGHTTKRREDPSAR